MHIVAQGSRFALVDPDSGDTIAVGRLDVAVDQSFVTDGLAKVLDVHFRVEEVIAKADA